MTHRVTLLEWVSGWWRRMTPDRDRGVAVVQTKRAALPVAAEYLSLYTYLEHRYASTVVLTFEQMEALLGFALPERARTDPHWWTSAAVRPDRHSDAWTVARRTALPNLLARTVAFERLT